MRDPNYSDKFKIVVEVCIKRKTNKDKSTEIISPLLPKPSYVYVRTCNAECQKRSAKGSNFKEDDSDLPPRTTYTTKYLNSNCTSCTAVHSLRSLATCSTVPSKPDDPG